MLVLDHEKYHKMKPSDLRWNGTLAFNLELLKPVGADGEQMSVAVPVYVEDSREDVIDRMNFMFSLVQDRLEDNNKAVLRANQETHQTTKDRIEAKIKDYVDKGQVPPKKYVESLDKLDMLMSGAQTVLDA